MLLKVGKVSYVLDSAVRVTGPILTGPILTGPILTGVTLTGVTLTGVTLTGVTLTGVTLITGTPADFFPLRADLFYFGERSSL